MKKKKNIKKKKRREAEPCLKHQQEQKKISLLTLLVGSESLAISMLLARSAFLQQRIVREFLLVATAVYLAKKLGMYLN
jgi:hypothetical protein